MQFEQLLEDYNYEYPESSIANSPANPRDSANLLIYNKKTNTTEFDTFKNLLTYLPKNAVLVLNETKVIPARFRGTKATGGEVEFLFLENKNENLHVLANKTLKQEQQIKLSENLFLSVANKLEKGYEVKLNTNISKFQSWLEENGETPIPPYIKNVSLTEQKLREEYQTVFARTPGSSAAPTASLHFTEELLNKLVDNGVQIEKILLHVGLGTFAPLKEKHINEGKLHAEYYEIEKETAEKLNNYKKEKRPIIAVGTTVVRTLESACLNNNQLTNLQGQTSLFIREGYNFKFVDGIITNFHVPKSSLLMLVAAFTGREKILDLYKQAIQKKYRLFSFGDGMLLL